MRHARMHHLSPAPTYQLPHTTYRTVTVMGAEVALG